MSPAELGACLAAPSECEARVLPIIAGARARALVEVLRADSRADSDIDALAPPDACAWIPELGLAERWCQQGQAGRAFLQLALAVAQPGESTLSACAQAGDEETFVYIRGWLVPVRGAAEIDVTASDVRLRSKAGEFTFGSHGGVRTGIPPRSWPVQPASDASSCTGPYAIGSALRPVPTQYPWPSDAQWRDGVLVAAPPAGTSVGEAWQWLQLHAPHYAAWVGASVAGVMMLGSPTHTGTLPLFSHHALPGLVAVPTMTDPIALAHMLVQEAARQHLIALMMVAETCDPTAVVYEPMTRRYAAVSGALASAHTWGNLLLYYREVAQNLPLPSLVTRRRDAAQLLFDEHCVAALADPSPLTEAGRALWSRMGELLGQDERCDA